MPMNLSPEHYQGIGEVVVVWAKLEAHVVRVLRSLTRMTFKEALVVYWQMGHRERVAVLRGLVCAKYVDKNDPLRKAFDVLTKRLEMAYSVRNTAAHSIWFPGFPPDEISPFDFDAKSLKVSLKKDPNRKSFKSAHFHKEALVIDRLAEDFKHFFSAHFRVSFIHKKQDNLD
jgi:hypothetical protein